MRDLALEPDRDRADLGRHLLLLEHIAAPDLGRILLEREAESPDLGRISRAQMAGAAAGSAQLMAGDAAEIAGHRCAQVILEIAHRAPRIRVAELEALRRERVAAEHARAE